MAKVKQTKSGNVRITLSMQEVGQLWGILSYSHVNYSAPKVVKFLAKCEPVSLKLCDGFNGAGLTYHVVAPAPEGRG